MSEPAAATSTTESAANFLRYVADKANFPSGIVLGIVLAGVSNWLANRGAHKERAKRMDIDAEREKELVKQLGLKDERLLELHKELAKGRNLPGKNGH